MHVTYDVTHALRAQSNHHEPIVLVIENHPNDSRVKIREDGVCQALTGRMGTGGGNTPLVMVLREEPNDST